MSGFYIYLTPNIDLCGLAWGARRPLQLEIADMREAKLEEGSGAVSFSSKSYEETSSCGVNGGMVAGWRAFCHTFVMDTGLGPEGSGLTVDVGARRVAVWRKTLGVWLMAKVSTKSVPAQTFFSKESLIKETF